MLLSTPKVSGLYSTERQGYVLSRSQTSLQGRGAGAAVMSSETFSLIVACWHDELASATRLRVVQVDTGAEVRLSDGSFLLRISRDENASVERCYIRHIASGREAYVQGGPNLRAFVNACLLNDGTSRPAATGTPESD